MALESSVNIMGFDTDHLCTRK